MRGRDAMVCSAALALVACDRVPATAPVAPRAALAASVAASAAQPVDVSGTWSWREEVVLQIPEAFALEFFGVQPEGPITFARCVNTGTMVLVQSGATFEGTATQAASCVSRGGQQFSPPAFTPTLDVRDGEISGRSIRVVFGAGDVPCLYHAAIAEVADGVALELRGGGRCIPPGHPQSPLSGLGLPFPSGPVGPTVLWEATRP
jgi:hypothetical protein